MSILRSQNAIFSALKNLVSDVKLGLNFTLRKEFQAARANAGIEAIVSRKIGISDCGCMGVWRYSHTARQLGYRRENRLAFGAVTPVLRNGVSHAPVWVYADMGAQPLYGAAGWK